VNSKSEALPIVHDASYHCDAAQWARATGLVIASAELRTSPSDFIVREQLGIAASGSGEHVLLEIQKTNLTTTMVAEAIAKLAAVSGREVSYAGLKDKRAVTQQTFSVHLPGKADPDWAKLAGLLNEKVTESDLQILSAQRHSRKIKTGAHQSNAFEITLRNLTSEASNTQSDLFALIEQRIQVIKEKGVPNYFGEQRFGHRGENVSKAIAFLNANKRLSKTKRSIYLSSVRAFLFNHLLEQRVSDGNWNKAVLGDQLSLAGSQSFFTLKPNEIASIEKRIGSGDLHISGLLYGDNEQFSQQLAGQYELNVARDYPELISILQNARLKSARRAFRVIPEKLEYEPLNASSLRLRFELPSGSYATAVLRELCCYVLADV